MKMINPKTELLKWGPLTARFYNISDFINGIFRLFPKKYSGEFWPQTLIICQEKRLIWINEFPKARKCGQSVFLKYMLPKAKRKKVWDDWKKNLKILNKVEEKIKKTSLANLSDNQFIDLWKEFHEALMGFWTDVVIPELANYGADKLLEKELGKYIKDRAELARSMEILTAPEDLSFYKKEELELLKAKDIGKHAGKYFWLKNSYAGTEFLEVDFFASRKKKLPSNLELELNKIKTKIQKRKKELTAKYDLGRNIIEISNAIIKGIEWQDERKKDIFIYLHYKNLLLKESARRLSIDKDDLLNFGTEEIFEFFENKSKDKIVNRRKGFAVVVDKDSLAYLDSSATKKLWNIYVEEKISAKVWELHGITVSRGKGLVRAKVRIVLDPSKSSSFKRGDILVAPMTSPEYIFVMQQSSAIVTDTGGLTSHAAIVSRELEIPCIVGTKIATKVLKDGMLVEVDANKGVVKILKK